MAVVIPFRALRYNEKKPGELERVLTQPYDKISPEMQRRYFAASPHTLAHLIKGESRPEDTATENVYMRAAEKLRQWRAEGVLTQENEPAFFAYYETFTPPSGTPPGGGEPLLRKGLIALGRVEPYEAGVVCRHEQTLMGPKKDRMELLRATRTHLESLFLLYSDPERKIESRMDEAAKGTPAVSVRDEYGVLHELWDVNDPETIRAIQQEMAAKKLIIADGHHRYETALAFGRECRESHSDQERDCGFALMTLVNMDGDGILILSGHRLVAGVADWSPAKFLEQAREFFDVKNHPFAPEADRSEASRNEAMNRLRAGMIREQANGGTPIGLLMNPGNTFYRLDLRPEVRDVQLEELLPELSPAQRGLDVTLLHRVLLERCLGMDEASVKKQQHLSYIRNWEDAVARVVNGVVNGPAQAAFFLNPLSMEQIATVAFQGRVLPQKSTDFYPKLLSGLVMYPLDH